MSETQRVATRAWGWVGMLLAVGVFVLAAGMFAEKQTVWLDETTQLEGIGLGPGRVTAWLTGQHDGDYWRREAFGYWVAPDRMPPLSYYYQQAWATATGRGLSAGRETETTLRWSGILCAAGAVALTFAISRRTHGNKAAMAAALLVGLAPAIIEKGVEIRAYPLYLLLATGAVYAATRYVQDERRGWLALAVGLAVAGFYTHLFGVVLAAALMGAVGVDCWLERKKLAGAIAGLAVVAVAGAGLWPFVHNSVEVSKGGAHFTLADKAVGVLDLFFSVVASRINLDSPMLVALSAVGMVLVVIAAVLGKVWRDRVNRLLLTTAGLTLGAVLAATLAVSSFKPGQHQYNIWISPVLAVLAGGTIVRGTTRVKQIAWVGVAMLLTTHAVGAWRMATEGETVAHGIDMRVLARIKSLGMNHVAVVHERDSQGVDVQAYYPLAYYTRGKLRQYMPEPDGSWRWYEEAASIRPAELQGVRWVLVIRGGPRDLLNPRLDAVRELAQGQACGELAKAGWKVQENYFYARYFKFGAWVWEKPGNGG